MKLTDIKTGMVMASPKENLIVYITHPWTKKYSFCLVLYNATKKQDRRGDRIYIYRSMITRFHPITGQRAELLKQEAGVK